jgi:hypothetical protein
MNRIHIHTPRWLLAGACALALMAGCGGGSEGAGLGSGGTGAAEETFAVGTVDGFGSIYVGGQRCDHLGARIAWDTVTGGPEPADPEIKLGQRLELDLDGAATGCRILAARIAPEVVGEVSSTAPLVVAGASVIVNTDPAAGPVTVFEGYDSAADIALGDRVEVHGKAVPSGTSVAIQASRIERRPATDTWVRVAGVIGNLDADSFTLGGLTVNYSAGTTVLPAGFALRDGLTVAIWSLQPVQAGNVVDARFIRVLRRQFADQQRVRVQGPVSGCNGANPCTEPVIDGINVLINADTTFTHGSAADVVDGRNLHVRGSFDAASGKLVARAVAVRRGDPEAGLVTLIGNVSDFASDGGETFFRVRGVPVTTDAGTTYVGSCAVSDDEFVAVAGRIVGNAVLASRISCPELAVGMVVDAYGSISALDSGARTFRLAGRPLLSLATLAWDDATVFRNGASAATLANGQYVVVRGIYQGNGRFLLQRVVLDETPPASPTGGLVYRAVGVAHGIDGLFMRVGLLRLAVTPASDVSPEVQNGVLVRAWFYRNVALGRWVALRVRPVAE